MDTCQSGITLQRYTRLISQRLSLHPLIGASPCQRDYWKQSSRICDEDLLQLLGDVAERILTLEYHRSSRRLQKQEDWDEVYEPWFVVPSRVNGSVVVQRLSEVVTIKVKRFRGVLVYIGHFDIRSMTSSTLFTNSAFTVLHHPGLHSACTVIHVKSEERTRRDVPCSTLRLCAVWRRAPPRVQATHLSDMLRPGPPTSLPASDCGLVSVFQHPFFAIKRPCQAFASCANPHISWAPRMLMWTATLRACLALTGHDDEVQCLVRRSCPFGSSEPPAVFTLGGRSSSVLRPRAQTFERPSIMLR